MNGLIRCAHCGRLIMRGSEPMEFVDGHFYCENCLEEETFICERCGERHLLDYETVVYDDYGDAVSWCADCAETFARRCADCGELFSDGYAMSCGSLVDGAGFDWVCGACLDEDYEVCAECGSIHRRDEMEYDDGNYNYYCEECWGDRVSSDNARVRSYHDAPPLRYIGECLPTWDGVWRGIGIELEIDRHERDYALEQDTLNKLNEIAGEHMHFEHDGSLNYGFEIVTQPHTISAFYDMPWEEILQICRDNGYDSHDIGTCGLHMHFSREMFGADEETQGDNIAKLMQFFELYWNDILKASRRTEEQAMHWASRYLTANKSKLKEYSKGDRYAGRYMAINLTNRHTVEIRIMRGTLNYESFMACCDFLITAVLNSCRIGWSDTTDDAEWLKGIRTSTETYLTGKGAFVETINYRM